MHGPDRSRGRPRYRAKTRRTSIPVGKWFVTVPGGSLDDILADQFPLVVGERESRKVGAVHDPADPAPQWRGELYPPQTLSVRRIVPSRPSPTRISPDTRVLRGRAVEEFEDVRVRLVEGDHRYRGTPRPPLRPRPHRHRYRSPPPARSPTTVSSASAGKGRTRDFQRQRGARERTESRSLGRIEARLGGWISSRRPLAATDGVKAEPPLVHRARGQSSGARRTELAPTPSHIQPVLSVRPSPVAGVDHAPQGRELSLRGQYAGSRRDSFKGV